MNQVHNSDVVVVGAGIAGSAVALLLARQGLSVCILDKAEHPRFALGESTLAATSCWMTLLAERWGVPELGTIAVASRINKNVAASSGVKKNFGFVYHHPGERNHSRTWHAPIPSGPEDHYGESHLFRQDIDAWLYHCAIEAGVDAFVGIDIAGVSIDQDQATLTAKDGRVFKSRFVVDASGFRSVISDAFELRERPTRLRTRSRSVFTHMVGVVPYGSLDGVPEPTTPWHQGTLHHCYKGGWIWVIPFDNHAASRNRLCSVGLNIRMDEGSNGAPRRDPEAEWASFLADHPSIARQFERARPVRPWVSTGRLQYSNHTCVGHRFWVTPHAAGAVDALYSRGLLITFQGIASGVREIMAAFESDDFEVDRFKAVDEQWRNMLDLHDHVVHGSFAALVDPDLFEYWLTIWLLTELVCVDHVLPALTNYAASGNIADLDFNTAEPAHCTSHYGFVGPLVERCSAAMVRFERGEVSLEKTRQELEENCQQTRQMLQYDHAKLALNLRNLTKPAPKLNGVGTHSGLAKMGLANFGLGKQILSLQWQKKPQRLTRFWRSFRNYLSVRR